MIQYIITGTTNGIGKGLKDLLEKDSEASIIGVSRSSAESKSSYTHIQLDLSDISAVKDFNMPAISENITKVVLINNAGILGNIKKIGQNSLENIENVMNVNYTSLMILTEKFVNAYQDLNLEKTIINISSGASKGPYSSWSNYCSSKAAVEMYSRVLNLEQQEQEFPVKCFAIAPGVVDTNMQKQIRSTDKKDFENIDKFIDLHNNNELYNNEDVARELIKVSKNPENYPEEVFRIQL